MNVYKTIVSKFPPQIAYCIAYGSGVKQQLGYAKSSETTNKSKSNPMIDLVFCVRNTREWHSKNLALHADHYSGLKHFGDDFIAKLQTDYGAKSYCNTLIDIDDLHVQIKYNVIAVDSFIDDLLTWRDLYMAGRMHKPITCVHNDGDNNLQSAIEQNLMSALRVALLLLPERFSPYQLFYKIAQLSYSGDFRMIFGENKNKVHNIVSPQIEEFWKLYKPSLAKLSSCVTATITEKQIQQQQQQPLHIDKTSNVCERIGDEGSLKVNSNKSNVIFEQDKSPAIMKNHLMNLPLHLNESMIANTKTIFSRNSVSTDDAMDKSKRSPIIDILAENEYLCQKVIADSVNNIVWRSSITQSIKNIPTAGITKSLFYSWKKALKTFN